MSEDHDSIRLVIHELANSAPPAPTFAEITRLTGQPDRLDASDASPVGHPQGPPTVVELGPAKAEDAPDYVTETPHHRAGPFRYMAAVVGFVLIAAGGVFAYGAATSNDGAATPDAAVQSFVKAVAAEDVAGVLESLPSNERVVLRESLESLKKQTDRLGLTDNIDLGHVSGLQVDVAGTGGAGPGTISDLTLKSEPLGDTVAAVTVDGTLRVNATDRELPLGPVARDLLVDSLPKDGYQGVADNIDRIINDNPVRLVTVKDDGGWHVSVWYTIAEYMRSSEKPVPAFGQRTIQPTGADSPEAAVRELIAAGQKGHYTAEIALTTPDESRVLYDYGPVFLAGNGMQPAVGYQQVDLKLSTTVEGEADTRTVVVRGWDITGSYEINADDYGGPAPAARSVRATTHSTFDGNCLVSRTSYDPPDGLSPSRNKICRSDVPAGTERDLWDLRATTRLTVQQVDGRWFVSPVRSIAGQVSHRLSEVADAASLSRLLESESGGLAFSFDAVYPAFGTLEPYWLYYGYGDEASGSAGGGSAVAISEATPASSLPASTSQQTPSTVPDSTVVPAVPTSTPTRPGG